MARLNHARSIIAAGLVLAALAAGARKTEAMQGCFPSRPVQPSNWRGEYHNNAELKGPAVMIRDDGGPELDFDWGLGGPSDACGVPKDNFSVRWTRRAAFSQGTWLFTITADDGVRVYIDRRLMLDKWVEQRASHSFSADLAAGNHDITVEYFERWGSAGISFGWAAHPCFAAVPPFRWKGEYFSNASLSGQPALVRDEGESALAFDSGAAARLPTACRLPAGAISARWSRRVPLDDARYRFTVSSAGGFRLLIDGKKALDRWTAPHPSPQSVEIEIAAGNHTITLEFFDPAGKAAASLDWIMAGAR